MACRDLTYRIYVSDVIDEIPLAKVNRYFTIWRTFFENSERSIIKVIEGFKYVKQYMRNTV